MTENARKQLIEGLDEMLVSALDVWVEQELTEEQRAEFDRLTAIAFDTGKDGVRDWFAAVIDGVCERYEKTTAGAARAVEAVKKARGKKGTSR